MINAFANRLQFLPELLDIIGASALIIGFIIVTVLRFCQYCTSTNSDSTIKNYRQSLGRVILIGLEILVASTIIKMFVLSPTIKGLAILVITVAIRTVLGWAVTLEMRHRWPWQK